MEIIYRLKEGMEAQHAAEIQKFVKLGDAEEPNTLMYWCHQDTAGAYHLREAFKDEDALMNHYNRAKDLLGPWIECLQDGKWESFTLYGGIGEAAREACTFRHGSLGVWILPSNGAAFPLD